MRGKGESEVKALVNIRSGSKGILDKNIRKMCAQPLVCWAIDAAVDCKFINDVWVSSDSERYLNYVPDHVGKVVRPEHLCTDDIALEPSLLWFADKEPFDVLVTIQATNPLITHLDLDGALEKFWYYDYDSMLSTVRMYRFGWTHEAKPINYDPKTRPNKQGFSDPIHIENGSFYITKREILEKEYCRLGGKIGMYDMDKTTLTEVDSEEDWKKVEAQLAISLS